MVFLYVLLTTYILAVNFLAFRLVKTQRDGWETGDREENDGCGKLLLSAALGGAAAAFATMFALRFRLENCLLMLLLPLLAVINLYCFYLGFRAIALVPIA